MGKEKKYALLIDADNVSTRYLNIMLDEAKNYGTVSIRRIYGDWTDASKKTWKDVLLENSIIPIQQYSYTTGKNASDSTMIIDAMDILYSNEIEGFIIASSDSDFTRLAMRLREAGKSVIGMGESKTPSAFVKSCEEFKTLDIIFKNTISEDMGGDEKETTADVETQDGIVPITDIAVINKSIFEILEKHSDEEGRMFLSELGRLLTKIHPDFDARNYGRYKKFIDFIREIEDLNVEMVYFDEGNKPPLAYVKKKQL